MPKLKLAAAVLRALHGMHLELTPATASPAESPMTAMLLLLVPAGLLHDLGLVLNTSQLRQAVEQLDTQSVGRVTFGEFLLWWKG